MQTDALHPHAPSSHVLTLASGRVHCTEAGSGAPLILLHANPGDSRDFEAVIPSLAQHHRVIALDWPGYGASPLPVHPQEWGAGHFVQVLRECMGALGLQRASLMGNSVGGNAALRLAIESPGMVDALVLVAPGGFTPHNAVTRGFCRLQGSVLSLPPRWWAGLYLRRRTATTQAMLARAAGEQASPERLALNRAVWRSFIQPDHDVRMAARRIQCPTLLIFGRHDPAIPAHKDGRQARLSMPHAQVEVMPCGHAPFAEMPEAFLRAVQPFLLGSLSDAVGAGEADAVGAGAGAGEAEPAVAAEARRRLR